jgi:hypothetical protein
MIIKLIDEIRYNILLWEILTSVPEHFLNNLNSKFL